MTDLQQEFANEMRDIYVKAKDQLGCNAVLFLRMLSQHGPVETARRLVLAPQMSDGYAFLWEHGQLELTVEALVVRRPEYKDLVGSDVVLAATDKLPSRGYVGS